LAIAADKSKLDALWRQLDFNHNGAVSLAGSCVWFGKSGFLSNVTTSLAEIDKFVVEKYPLLNHKPALMRAYKRTVSREGGGDGDDYVVRGFHSALHSFPAQLIVALPRLLGKSRVLCVAREFVLLYQAVGCV
jgi:hypothetical protein